MRKLKLVGTKLGILASGVLLAVFVAATLWADSYMRRNIELVMYRQAQSLHKQVVLMRHWNASYGGVFVRKQPGIETNPYLYQVGPGEGKPSTVIPEIRDDLGNVYTLKNPALMGRELSELTEKYADIRFRLTSLRPVNPLNTPDDFERRSLENFAVGAKEVTEFSQINGKQFYRYMAPVYIEETCLQCHGFQGYKIGDVRGGISVSLPVENEALVFMENRGRFIFFAGLLSVLVGATIILGSYFIIMRPLRAMTKYAGSMGGHQLLPTQITARQDEVGLLARELNSANTALHSQREQLHQRTMQLEHESRTDALTELYNRRYLFSEGARLYERWQRDGTEIVILLMDIDHFKHINDTYGHQAGDQVLIEVAQVLKQQCRPYDLIARYGGEEFVIMLEASTPNSGESTAKRIHQSIGEHVIKYEDKELLVTASVGLIEGKDLGDFDTALRKADEALYEAKEGGRNRITIYGQERK